MPCWAWDCGFFSGQAITPTLRASMSPDFPTDTMDLIHGLRAFFPMLAGWIALLMIFTRSSRLFPWIMGPLGLMLLYAVTGLVSSATISVDPDFALYYGANYLAIVLVLLAIVLVEDPLPDLLKVLKPHLDCGHDSYAQPAGRHPLPGFAGHYETDATPVGMRAYDPGWTRSWGWLRLETPDLPGMRPSPHWWRSLGL